MAKKQKGKINKKKIKDKRKSKKGNIKNKKKNNTKELIALTFALSAVALLLINAIYILMTRDNVISKILDNEEFQGSEAEIIAIVPIAIGILIFSWFVLAVLFSLSIYFIEKEKWKWYSLLILSFISLILIRIDSFVLGLLASFLYKKLK